MPADRNADDVDPRLNRFLAMGGVASRRGAEEIVTAGRVTIDGTVVTDLARRVPKGADVRVDGKRVRAERIVHLVLHKPKGHVTTVSDPQGRRTVMDLIDVPERVVPVGRLDLETTGILLLTNDGELSTLLMHPSSGVPKTYRATVRGPVSATDVQALATGVDLDDGRTLPAEVKVVDRSASRTVLEIVLHEGRNRQIRRMCDAIGHPVVELHRSGYGPLVLRGLPLGAWRAISGSELTDLRTYARGERPAPRKAPKHRR